jgi:hypothetical protein
MERRRKEWELWNQIRKAEEAAKAKEAQRKTPPDHRNLARLHSLTRHRDARTGWSQQRTNQSADSCKITMHLTVRRK